MRFIVMFGLAFAFVGCGLTATERQGIIDAATAQASAVAYETTYSKVKAHLVEQGKSIEEAEKLAREAADVAGKAAGAVAGKGAGSAADALGSEKRSKTTGFLASLIPILLGVGGDLLKRYASGGVA